MPETMQSIAERLMPHGRFEIVRRIDSGHRNLAFMVRSAPGRLFVAKTTSRDERAVAWAADLQDMAVRSGLSVARYLKAPDGRHVTGGMTLEPMVQGRPAEAGELDLIRPALARLRSATRDWPQRPGFASAASLVVSARGGDVDMTMMPPEVTEACRAAWRPLVGRRETAVHGDLHGSNLVVGADGPVLLDWDEARRDSPLFDLAPFSTRSPALARARLAWEVAAGWRREPAYARALSNDLLGLATYPRPL